MSKPELKRATIMNTLRTLRLAPALLIGLAVAPGACADDIDIFLGLSGGSADAPHVMVLLHNGPHRSGQAHRWADPPVATITHGVAELQALRQVLPSFSTDALPLPGDL